jgi:hypothetical protein
MGYYHKGDDVPLPLSPVDNSLFSAEEIIMLPIFATNGPVTDNFLPGQVNFPTLAPFTSGRPIIVPYHHEFDQPNGKIIDDIYAFATGNQNSQVYDWGASLVLAITQRLGIFLQDQLSGASSNATGGGSSGTGGTGTGGSSPGSGSGGGPGVGGGFAPPDATIALTPSTMGNFTVAHGLGAVPADVDIQMTSDGEIWEYAAADATNLYLTASAGGITGNALVWLPA